jgi:hypothetical protein
LPDGQTDILQRDPRAIAMADAIDLKRRNLGRLGSLHDHFRNINAQVLMPDIGRLAYRVWCGKVRGQGPWPRSMATRGALATTKSQLQRKTRLPRLNLTSIVDPDKVLQRTLCKFAIATIITDGLGGW